MIFSRWRKGLELAIKVPFDSFRYFNAKLNGYQFSQKNLKKELQNQFLLFSSFGKSPTYGFKERNYEFRGPDC
jgi:hypothetical protein